jgi:hypothetical protein
MEQCVVQSPVALIFCAASFFVEFYFYCVVARPYAKGYFNFLILVLRTPRSMVSTGENGAARL